MPLQVYATHIASILISLQHTTTESNFERPKFETLNNSHRTISITADLRSHSEFFSTVTKHHFNSFGRDMMPSLRNGLRRIGEWFRGRRRNSRYVNRNQNAVATDSTRYSLNIHRLTFDVRKLAIRMKHNLRKRGQGSWHGCWQSRWNDRDI